MARAKITKRTPIKPAADPPVEVTPPATRSRPYQRSKSNAGLYEQDFVPSWSPPESGVKSPIKRPKVSNFGIVTGVRNRNQPV